MSNARMELHIEGPAPLEVTLNPTTGAADIRVRQGRVTGTVQHSQGVYLDVDAEGLLLGIELLLPVPPTRVALASRKYLSGAGSADLRRAVAMATRAITAAVA